MKRLMAWCTMASFCAVAVPARAAGNPRVTKGPWLAHVTPSSAVVRVEVDPPAPVRLELRVPVAATAKITSDGASPAVSSSLVASHETARSAPEAFHSFAVTGLHPSTRYEVRVLSNTSGSATASQALGTATFATGPARVASSEGPFRFSVYGDNRTDDAAHASVVRAMLRVPAAFAVNTGDLVANGGSSDDWQTFFDIEAPLLRDRPIFAAVGNHELVHGSGAYYIRYFGPQPPSFSTVAPGSGAESAAVPAITPAPSSPTALSLDQLRGTFRWSNTRFFLLNGMVPHNSGDSRNWLEGALTSADSEPGLTWRVVVVHHGPWSSGPHGDNALLQDARIPQLLRDHKVDLILSGHDHIYERGFAEGLAFVVSGGGGAPSYPTGKPTAGSRYRESARHFLDVTVDSSAIALAALRPDGSLIESCKLQKLDGWDCDGRQSPQASSAAAASSSSAGVPAVVTGSPSASRGVRCACRIVSYPTSRSERGVTYVVAAALAAAMIRRVRRERVR